MGGGCPWYSVFDKIHSFRLPRSVGIVWYCRSVRRQAGTCRGSPPAADRPVPTRRAGVAGSTGRRGCCRRGVGDDATRRYSVTPTLRSTGATSARYGTTQTLTDHVRAGDAAEVLINYELTCSCLPCFCLQCFDAVGWAAGKASGL